MVNKDNFAIASAPVLPEFDEIDYENEINNKIGLIEDL